MIMLKRMISSVLTCCGIHSLLDRICLADKAFVLMYHRVLASACDEPLFVQSGMFVTTASFTRQIEYLAGRFQIVHLEDLVERVVNGANIGGLCAITFDDGWLDNYTQAFPVLEKFCAPATIFLASGFIGTDRIYWPEELSHYLDRMKDTVDGAPAVLLRYQKEIGSRREHISREAYLDNGIETLKKYSPNERNEILGFLRGAFRADQIPRQMLNWEEAREMLANGLVQFGAHTVNHEILDCLSLQKARDEIVQSRRHIESRLGSKVRTFAYPNGNHNIKIRKLVEENGFRSAVTTRKALLYGDVPLMEIPRIAMHDDVSNTLSMFRSRILLPYF